MIALAYLCVAGIIQFAELPLPGLEVGSTSFPNSTPTTNVCTADIDEDGFADLVLPSGVWLQRGGLFSRAAFVAMPESVGIEAFHAEKGRLYIYGEGRCLGFSLFAQRWQNEWSADLAVGRGPAGSIQPLFHDIDSDGHVELVFPLDDKLAIYRVAASGQWIAELPVYPPRRPQLDGVSNLWASLSRPPVAPIESRDFRVGFEGPALTIREALRVGHRRIEYRSTSFVIQQNSDGTYSCTPSESWTSGSLPDVMTPYRSQGSKALAFAGARPVRSSARRLGDSLTEALLKTRRDESTQTLRTKAPVPLLALADFDGDGDEDLLTQSSTLHSGPPREVLMRLASAHTVRHEFFVHVQDADGKFDGTPRQTLAVELDLDTTALEEGPRWQAYRRGALTRASADFNGDRRADIAAWTTAGRLRVWLNHEGVFPKVPDAELSLSKGAGIAAVDVDQDGRADLVILPEPASAAPPLVWFSR